MQLPKPTSLRRISTFTTVNFFLGCLLLFTFVGQAQAQKLTAHQQDFLDAWEAIKKNDRPAIAKYKKKLKGYALEPYVLYHDYRRNIKRTPDHLIVQFINENDNHLGDNLRKFWLEKLAQKKNWTQFLKTYRPKASNSTSLQCYYIQALVNKGSKQQKVQAKTLAENLWRSHTKLPKACYPVDNWLRNHKYLTSEIVWKRIALSISKRKYSRADYLKKDLSKKDQKMVTEWIRIVRNPSVIKKPLKKSLSPYVKSRAFSQAARYYASKNPAEAKRLLDKYEKKYSLSATQKQELERRIALRSAYKYQDASEKLLTLVNTNGAKTEETLRWQAQIALKNSNWLDLMDAIDLMPAEMQQESKWQYWQARALEMTKQKAKANKIFKQLAKKRNYYGFLAADKLNLPYQFNPEPKVKFDRKELQKKYPALKRIQELMAVSWLKSSRTEWYHFLKKADKNDLAAVAAIAHEWKEYPYAIRSLAIAKQWDHLDLRFPTPHKQPVMVSAEKNAIDPAWIYGIIRRESAFNSEIRSPAGAIGLMQLMPRTAKYIGKKNGFKKTDYHNLTHAQNNIQLGSAYMSYLSKKYDGNIVLATAAYNAGPHRVSRWIKGHHDFSADQWVDTIPFSETRAYVKAVLEYTTIFKSILNGEYDRLRLVMPNIGKAKSKKG